LDDNEPIGPDMPVGPDLTVGDYLGIVRLIFRLSDRARLTRPFVAKSLLPVDCHP